MMSPELNFYPWDGTFRLYPSAPWADDHGARSFRVDPGDFASADFFNARSSQYRWPAFEDEIEFADFVQFVVHNLTVVDPDESDKYLLLKASLAALTASNNIGLEQVVRRLRDLQRAVA